MTFYFLKLFEYNNWANKRVLACLKNQKVSHERILSIMGHILAAQFVWFHRIKNLPPPTLALWANYTLDQLESLTTESGRNWIDFINAGTDFNDEVTYANQAGVRFTNTVETIVVQTTNHATYHRAQIALLLRENGLEAVNTDFIMYDRYLQGQV